MMFSVIKDKDFEQTMINEVEPFLASLRKEGVFESFDSKKIHYEYYVNDAATSNVVFSHGFTESAEKFREVYYYFIKAGFNVFAVDQRGHGNSYRKPGDLNTVKIGTFHEYVDDLNVFVEKIVKEAAPDKKMFLYSHSMGGAVAILFIEKYPDVFEKAILSAPMVCANTGMPENVTKLVTNLFSAIGFADKKVFGRGDFNPNATYEDSNDTCKERFDYYQAKKCRMPQYRTSSPSFNWVKQAMINTDYIVKSENIDKIKAQVLLCQPETDKMVLPEYQNDFISKVKNGKKIRYANAKHEIYNSTEDVLLKYYPDLFEFLNN